MDEILSSTEELGYETRIDLAYSSNESYFWL